ncbi:hypothetical protein, partial [Romboutsia sp.]|uniref:hypothetical protein n=1 Tax=Romboutsia sp. TaxID=1965302 RepID=UPI003F3F4D7E
TFYNYNKFKEKVNKIMSSVFNVPMKLQLLASDETTDETTDEKILKLQQQIIKLNEVTTENEKLKDMNEKLFTKNQEYFLKITNDTTINETHEINEYEEFLGKDFYDKLSNKEKKQIKTILEGDDE